MDASRMSQGQLIAVAAAAITTGGCMAAQEEV